MTDAGDYSLPRKFYEEANRWIDRRDAKEPGLEPKLEAWLNADPRNRQAFKETIAALAETGLMSRGAAGFDGKLPKAPFYERRSTHVALAAAAAVVAAGFASLWLNSHRLFPEIVVPAQAATYETQVGEIRTFGLPDASSITLDTDTRVSVSVSGDTRRIDVLRGRFRLNNAGEADTYVVTAGRLSATVKAGAFDVRREAGSLRISAPQKPVELSAADPASGAPRQIALGSQIEIGSRGAAMPLSRVDVEWISGMLALDGNRLDDAITAINRYNRLKIVLAASDLGGRKLTGGFRVNDPEGFAEAVARMFDLRIDRPNPSEIVLSRP